MGDKKIHDTSTGSILEEPSQLQNQTPLKQSSGFVSNSSSRSLLRFDHRALLITLGVAALLSVVLVGILVVWLGGYGNKHNNRVASYVPTSGPLSAANGIAVLPGKGVNTLAVNGKLQINNDLTLAPTATPSAPTTGEIYYDGSTNTPYFYNGSNFVSLDPTTTPHVTSLGGTSGVIGLGSGLAITNDQLSLSTSLMQSVDSAALTPQVTSVQGQNGDVTFTAGSGISINGTTISSTETSLQAGNGIAIAGNQITNNGVVSLVSSGHTVDVTSEGNGVYDLEDSSAGSVKSLTSTNGSLSVTDEGSGSYNLQIASSGVTSGSYGDAADVARFTVNGSGQITSASSSPISIDGSQITSGTVAIAYLPSDIATYDNAISDFTGTLQQGGNEVCDTSGNCTGVPGGALGGYGNAGTIALFTSNGYNLGNSMLTQSGSTVTAAGNLAVQGNALISTSTNTTTAFQVQNAAGSNVLDVDTTDGQIDLGTLATPSTPTMSPALTGGLLTGGSTYYFRVVAVNNTGVSAPSTEESETLNQTLTVPTGVSATANTTAGSLNTSTTYYYKVTAVTANGETTTSTQVSANTGSDTAVKISWTAITGAVSYNVYRGTTSNGENLYYNTATNSYIDTGSAATSGTPPGTNTATTNTNKITLVWGAVSSATSYDVYYGTTSGGEADYFATTATSYTMTATGGTAGVPPVAATGQTNVLSVIQNTLGNTNINGKLTVSGYTTDDLYANGASDLKTDAGLEVMGDSSIGTATTYTDVALNIVQTPTDTSSSNNPSGLLVQQTASPTANSASGFDGGEFYSETTSNNTHTFTGGLTGVVGDAESLGTGSVASLWGATGQAANDSTSTVTNGIGDYGGVWNENAGTITTALGTYSAVANFDNGSIGTAIGLQTSVSNTGTGDINTGYGIEVLSGLNTGGGTFENNYGLYIQDQSGVGSVNSYNLYSAGATAKNYIAGLLEVGASLNVSGPTTLSDLTVTGLTSVADIQVSGHVTTSGTAPTATVQTAAGSSATCTVTGNDTNGHITLKTGTSGWAAGAQCLLTFATPYSTTPNPVITETDDSGLMQAAPTTLLKDTASGFTIEFTIPDTAQHNYTWDYWNAGD